MSLSTENWWKLWAPYWEYLENRHLSTEVMDGFLSGAKSPSLVIGAGQGLIVERLRQQGLKAEGVDLEPEMIAMAKKRRGIELTLADASKLPYKDDSFRTTIIATGVLDYLDNEETIFGIIREAARVTADGGELILTFYKLPSRQERIYRNLGVITADNRYRLRRIFQIMKDYEQSFKLPVNNISEWTGRSLTSALVYWLILGITLPKQMRAEGKQMSKIFSSAEKEGISRDALVNSVPESLPYRKESEVFDLAERAGLRAFAAWSGPDCTVVRHRLFGKLNQGQYGIKSSSSGNNDCIIKTSKLTKVFGDGGLRAVDGLTISVKSGTIYGILGPNGAGKTTTLGMLSGLVTPTGGEIVFGEGLNRKRIRKDIGYVPQKLALYERLSAVENLRFFAGLYGIEGARFKERLKVVLDMTGLSSRAHEPISRFSGGMLRRLNLAAGLLHEPKIILLDEPTVGIDPQSRNRIFDAVLELKRKGATILYTTHYMEEAMTLCDTIAIMDHGRVVLENDPSSALAEYGLSEIQFTADKPVNSDLLAEILKIKGVKTASFNEPVLTVRSRHSNAKKIITAIEDVCRNKVSISLKCFVEPTLEKLFLDITGRSLRDERDAS